MGIANRFLRNEEGQDIVEYSLLIVFVLIASAIILNQTGSAIVPVWVSGNAVVLDAAQMSS